MRPCCKNCLFDLFDCLTLGCAKIWSNFSDAALTFLTITLRLSCLVWVHHKWALFYSQLLLNHAAPCIGRMWCAHMYLTHKCVSPGGQLLSRLHNKTDANSFNSVSAFKQLAVLITHQNPAHFQANSEMCSLRFKRKSFDLFKRKLFHALSALFGL